MDISYLYREKLKEV